MLYKEPHIKLLGTRLSRLPRGSNKKACSACEAPVRYCKFCNSRIYFTQYRKAVNYEDGSLHRCLVQGSKRI